MNQIKKKKPWGVVFKLSLSDLIHEWILTLCLVMAVAAVLSPLLILFGLKFGTIEVLRYRLIQDPRNREIRPMVSRSFERKWFDEVRNRSDVAFVIPTTRQISAMVDAQVKGHANTDGVKKISLDVIPTSDGDRLIIENGAKIPDTGQCVLTEAAAEALEAKEGDTLIVAAKRLKGSRYEKGLMSLQVSGVLTPRAGTLKSLYVRLEVLEAVERYKDGQAVPEYGWPGSTPKAYPLYDGLAVILPKAMNKIEEFKLINNTGFTKIEKLTKPSLFEQTGYRLSSENHIYLVSTKRKPAGQESVRSVGHRLRGKKAILLPWVKTIKAELLDASGRTVKTLSLHGLTLSPEKAKKIGLTPLPNWTDENNSRDSGQETNQLRKILLSEGWDKSTGSVQLRVTRGKESLQFPVEVDTMSFGEETAPGQTAFIPSTLAGIINLFNRRNISFNEQTEGFILARRGYAGFRLYAASIDGVQQLEQHFEEEGIPVHTEAGRIRDVKELDTYLTLIFWLIATVGVIGGLASLMASLYASVERKRRDLSVLRLIGLSGATLFRFPVYQSLIITVCGFAVALFFFESLAWVINYLFQSHLQAEESLCRLAPWHIGTTLGVIMTVAILAGITAAWRVTRIDPAEALRDE